MKPFHFIVLALLLSLSARDYSDRDGVTAVFAAVLHHLAAVVCWLLFFFQTWRGKGEWL